MPWTLYRYILKELLKLIVVTTVVLVVVMSFAATVKPLADGLIGPAALAKFLFYSAPTMLGFVVPFAGAFASTLVFIRMTNDNEIVACSASGMSYFQILMPVIALGLTLTMLLFGLSNFVIPGFWRAAAQTLEKDFMSVLVTNLNEDRPFEIGDVWVYADHAEVIDDPVMPEGERVPERYIGLYGVAVCFIDRAGRIERDATAEVAHIALYRDEDGSWIKVKLTNAMGYDPDRGLVKYDQIHDIPAVRLPSTVNERAKYLSLPELRRLQRHPERFERIRTHMDKLIGAMAAENMRSVLYAALRESDGAAPINFAGPQPGEVYTVRAPAVSKHEDALLLEEKDEQKVEIGYRGGSGPDLHYETSAAMLGVVEGDEPGQTVVQITMPEVLVYDRPGGTSTDREDRRLQGLTWPHPVTNNVINGGTMWDVLKIADQPTYAESDRVRRAAEELRWDWYKVQRRIRGRLHERAASAIACFLLLLLGAVLSLLIRGQLPLVVFFWSFMLAIVAIILINTGWSVTRDVKRSLLLGLTVMWFGNVALGVVGGAVYCKLARN